MERHGASDASGAPSLAALNLSEILPAIDGLLFLLSQDGTIHDFRAGTSGQLFVPPERFLGRNIRELLPAESAAAVSLALSASSADQSNRIVYTLPFPDGTRTYEAQLIPLSSGHRLAIVWHVSDRVRVASELHAKGTRLRAILEASPECVLMADRNGQLQEVNPAGLVMLEEPDLASAQRHNIGQCVTAAHREAFARLVERVFAGESCTLTFEMEGRAGTRRWVESSAVPLREASGAITSMLAVTRDVTARRRAEAALRESERRLSEAVQTYGIGIFDHDHRADSLYYSAELRAMRGWDLERVVTVAGVVAGVHPDDREQVRAAIARAHDPAGDGTFKVQYRVVRPDGTVRWLSSRSHTTFEGTGKDRHPVRTVGAINDITEEREREEALRLKDAAIDASLNGIAIATLDGTLTYVNPAFLRMWGFTHTREATGRSALEFWEHADEARNILESLASHNSWQGELTARRADGSTFLVALAASVVRDPLGRAERIMASFVDVTDRRLAQEALRQSEERFRALIENGLDLVLTLDRDGRIRFASPSVAAILGYPAHEVTGRALHDFLHPDDAAQIGPRLLELYAGARDSSRLAFRVRHRSGDWRVLEGIARSLLHVRAVRGTVANLRDVTEQRDLEARLRQSQKLDSIGRLAGGVAHDFNNILTAILGYTQLLEDAQRQGHGTCLDDLREVRLAAERARALTAQLLAFARRQVVSPRAVDLNDVVRQSERMLARLVGEDITIVTEFEPAPWRVQIDPSQLEQVIVNLSVNARDAMRHGGRLSFATENVVLAEDQVIEDQTIAAGPFAMLTVSDTGTGIASEALPHLFEPFYTTKGAGEGTGLGLATVYGIVRQAGGMIEVESTLGHGTRFRIYLPRATSEGSPLDAVEPAASAARGSERILVAEDDPSVRSLTVRALRDAGFVVDAAPSATDALDRVASAAEPFQLLVTDVIMPGMSGAALADQLRETHPHMRVLFVSGYPQDRIGDHGILREGVAFLPKPFTPRQLVTRVREVLDG